NRIHIYGASTKGNTILQWCEIDTRLIDFAAERNPDKYGALTLGTEIPIISEEESRKMKPDYYLVLPWHFKEEFLQREKKTIEAGTKLIFPLPQIDIIG
ncbi:MAG: class I SAM-dependent methyltransferase, partial [Gammaproteobacteria bacterium]|nr:class I SAM-dependent methyltransferase [Gammaproteobacteria bacterium]